MKILNRSLPGASVALLVVQLVLVSGVAAKYEYQRWRCPRVWTRAFGYDPQLVVRGRYLSLQLQVDGCQSTLPSAKDALFPRDVNGAAKSGPFFIRMQPAVEFRANLKVQANRLIAIRLPDGAPATEGQLIEGWPGKSCREMTLEAPVDYYIPGNAPELFPLKPGQELWMEVTVPPQGLPRPTQLALKDNGAWKPMAY